MKFSYYPGCSLEATAKEYDLSARAACQALDVELQELDDWVCCGATSAHSINKTLSVSLPAKNIAIAQQVGHDLVIPCSACYNMLKKADHHMRNDSDVRGKMEEIVDFKYTGDVNVLSLLEAMVNRLGIDNIAQKVVNPLKDLKVVCYYGCLLVRPPEITHFDRDENPESMDNLVKSLGATVIPWSYKTDCCGANLGLTSSDVVQGMVGRLLDAAKEAGADAIVTSCPLCHSNLEMRRKEHGTDLPVFYFTELMGLALGLKDCTNWFSTHLIDPRPLLRSVSLI
ncbi:MAG: CoB--CoM heterodisulfide reductase iron-sulfur subunit B family protein [Clostridiales bacterium]|nr:CoB--CoM heterodisulfide reductase iron-sulfur subunit B family protein [Clostridiales bacterium]MCF8021980.1 CoB--CoM heterodisulfide reductase iron-sulfur subunit B family protein [Clostridiales bacterium]